ncbi:response regulator transcription factor [Campylobacter canadensis]|uniref:Response regulator n=1 Tax=Campylobacter canadensis TaxID=449520 RepID=A0ABS7WTC4_9BACT|nr:response regulator [Campylobacter canadensis]MBZ7987621.1 response regulator [Campylobacter canadensis]MBZ7994944.1 response regulator [Campylobacter canadensis]MBZ7996906.1 response regulator [Campylobacter canadensis]MBZ7998733.1 response regulator [Campylobacter canadensis]MBZ8000385.1 response regulator [Campylobacter canadensis]
MNELINIFKHLTVLNVEDEEEVRKALSANLSLFFKNVYEAKDGKEALDIFYEKKPDVIFMDICIPKINGIKVLKELRNNYKKIPIIIMSAYNEQEYFLQAIELNICKFLIKPFSKDDFLTSLKNAAKWMYDYTDEYKIIINKNIIYEPLKSSISYENKTHILTKKEKQVFEYLLKHKNCVVSFEQLEFELYNDSNEHKDALKAVIKQLRKKLPNKIIKNIFGVGYQCLCE